MKKLGPMLAIFSGLAIAVLATLSLLLTKNVFSPEMTNNMKWLADFQNKAKLIDTAATASVIYGILIGIGVFELILGVVAWNNSHGFAAFVLLGLIVTSMVFAIIGGVKANSFPTGTIIMLSIQGIATLGMLSGFLNK